MVDEPRAGVAAADDRGAGLRARGTLRRFPKGTVLFREGRPSESVVLIRSGSVKVSHLTRGGREVLLAVRGAGEILGELGVLDDAPRSATVTAIDDVEAVVVAADVYRDLVASDPELAVRLLRLVIERLRAADRMLIEHGAYDTRTRLALRLLELAERPEQPAGEQLVLRFSQDDLAGWVGASREAVNKALRVLRDDGLITTGRGTITILDLERLARLADR